jgi:peptidylprolyl isomerase
MNPTGRTLAAARRLTALATLGALVAACGAGTTQETTVTTGESATSGPVGSAPDATAILDAVHPDRGEPPTELGIVDLVVGSGDPVGAGDRVVVQYHGLRWSDGGTFDASWTRGQPFSFLLSSGQVIPGWDLGVAGMQLGGRRVLTIPPALAYGDRGAGGVIGPGETLVFIVDLVEVDRS